MPNDRAKIDELMALRNLYAQEEHSDEPPSEHDLGYEQACAEFVQHLDPIIAALSTPARQAGDDVEYRLWDTQWVSVVNHDRAYADWDQEMAIHHAVKLTEQAMAKNARDGKWPPPRATKSAPQPPQGGGGEVG
jgi:hypothetical protein